MTSTRETKTTAYQTFFGTKDLFYIQPATLICLLLLCCRKPTIRGLCTLHLLVGRGCPDKKELIRARASLGLFKGTKCPAPRTVTIVTPSYSTSLPPTCIFYDHHLTSRQVFYVSIISTKKL